MDKEERNEIERTEKGKFKKGVSGNPSGRPKGGATPAKHVKTILCEILEANDFEGLKSLLKTMLARAVDDGDTKAAELIMKYYVGTPRQVDLDGMDADGMHRVSVEVVHTYTQKAQDTAEFDQDFDPDMIPE